MSSRPVSSPQLPAMQGRTGGAASRGRRGHPSSPCQRSGAGWAAGSPCESSPGPASALHPQLLSGLRGGMRVPCPEPALLCQNKVRLQKLCPRLHFRGHSEADAAPGPPPHAGWWGEQPWSTEGHSGPMGTPRWALGPLSPKGAGVGGFWEGDAGQRQLPVTGWPQPQPVAKEQIFSPLAQCPPDPWACGLPGGPWTTSPIGRSIIG